MIHSDRGFQYTSRGSGYDRGRRTDPQHVRVGRCLDNAPIEGFWGTLKSRDVLPA